MRSGDLHLIQSALARPYGGHYPRIWQKAAAFVESMVTTLILLHTLLNESGYELVPSGDEDREQAVENAILSAASGSASFEELTDWFKVRIRPTTA
jgi:death on curing protein